MAYRGVSSCVESSPCRSRYEQAGIRGGPAVLLIVTFAAATCSFSSTLKYYYSLFSAF
jgi:hypothetical protein